MGGAGRCDTAQLVDRGQPLAGAERGRWPDGATPFAGLGLRFVPDPRLRGESARAVVDREGRRWKLRSCGTPERAAEVEDRIRALEGVFRPVLAREGRWLLCEHLPWAAPLTVRGWVEHASAVGRLCAAVHARGTPRPGDAARFFERRLERLLAARAVDRPLARAARARHDALARRLEVVTTLDLHDPHAGNFGLDPQGRLWALDEESVGPRIRGLGIGFVHRALGGTDAWSAFLEGYAAEGDARFLTPEYLAYVSLVQSVVSLDFAVRAGLGGVDAATEDVRRWSAGSAPGAGSRERARLRPSAARG